MKELSIEEKAKAYDEVLKKARMFYKDEHVDNEVNSLLEVLFPELKESEDERIRKHLKAVVKEYDMWAERGLDMNDVLAWLEKQGEIDKASYEIAEKEKQKFVGDGFIKCHANFQDFKEGSTYWLEYIGNDNYNVRSDNLLGKTYHITPCQLYTIFKKQTYLEKQGEQKLTEFERAVKQVMEEVIECGDTHNLKADAEMLLSLAQKSDEEYNITGIHSKHAEGKLSEMIKNLKSVNEMKVEPKFKVGDVLCDKSCTTLNKDGQPNLEIIDIKDGVYICDNGSIPVSQQDNFELIAKKIEHNPAWSEEDDKMLDSFLHKLEVCDLLSNKEGVWIKNKLKNIKERVQPQSTWKPSDAQIEALDFAADCIVPAEFNFKRKELKELLEQLKKLREE